MGMRAILVKWPKTFVIFLKYYLMNIRSERIIDGLGLIRLFFWFPERGHWASDAMHVVSVQ